ncbi:ECF transporter S component [Atopobacter sp. AH10]|uniref:ECF transporter S component n=1 Tax=Atopobacter sp. AH10 TaxID=2315861 RepID=UPI000EF19BF7|nr:ECF transporter S component [Atopobacter sp. AH10]RLK62686.1 ECF transporter S component [Atopobacter sp. AH10]
MQKRFLPHIAIMIALTTVLSLHVLIPVPATKGIITLCEAGIYTTSLLLGPIPGAIVGAATGGLVDFISGFSEWMPWSIAIHGLQGLLAGYLARHFKPSGQIVGLVLASLLMVTGYAFATYLMYDWPATLASIPSNLAQCGLGILVALPLYQALKKIKLAGFSK